MFFYSENIHNMCKMFYYRKQPKTKTKTNESKNTRSITQDEFRSKNKFKRKSQKPNHCKNCADVNMFVKKYDNYEHKSEQTKLFKYFTIKTKKNAMKKHFTHVICIS